MTWNQLIARLRDRRLIAPNAQPPEPQAGQPWALEVLALIGAWMAAAFLLGFIAATAWAIMLQAAARLLFGGLLCGGVAYLSWRSGGENLLAIEVPGAVDPPATLTKTATTIPAPTGDDQAVSTAAAPACPGAPTASSPSPRAELGASFLSQFLAAISIAGWVLIVSSAFELRYDEHLPTVIAGVGLGSALILWLANRDRMHQRYMAWLATACFIWMAYAENAIPLSLGLLAAAAAAILLSQRRWLATDWAPLLSPIGHACATGALCVSLMPVVSPYIDRSFVSRDLLEPWSPWATILVFFVMVGVVLVLSERWRARVPVLIGALIALLLVTWGSMHMPGVLTAILVWTMATASGRLVLRALALIALPIGVLLLYFDLHTTLLHKGLSLLGIGAVLAVSSVLLGVAAVDGDDEV